MNNFLVVVTPTSGDLYAAVAQSNKTGDQAGRDMIPKAWGGVYQRRFIPLEEVPYFEKAPLQAEGVTHLALLTGPGDTDDPFWFNGEPVAAHSIMCWFKEASNQYGFIHCADCATTLVMFLDTNQEKWCAHGRSEKAAGTCH